MTSMVERARNFDAWADDYDRFRPGYPDALFDEISHRLALPPAPLVVDLGAGTGRATLPMAARGWRVTAIEPGRPMLDILRARASEHGLVVATVPATAEATGIDPSSVDLVTAAQAFHWFDKPRAVAEMTRILRPGGGVALFWNVRDESRSAFVADYHAQLERWFGDADTGRYLQAGRSTGREATRAAFSGVEGFDALELNEVHHELGMTAEAFIGMAFTASYVRTLSPDDQSRFRGELGELLERHGLAGGQTFAVPYRIDLWTATRRGS
jgi:SAM-dependent methyltransferase